MVNCPSVEVQLALIHYYFDTLCQYNGQVGMSQGITSGSLGNVMGSMLALHWEEMLCLNPVFCEIFSLPREIGAMTRIKLHVVRLLNLPCAKVHCLHVCNCK